MDIAPIATQLGVGGVMGLVLGYLAKKVLKWMIIIFTVLTVPTIAGLYYAGLISFNVDVLKDLAVNLGSRLGNIPYLDVLISNMPIVGSFLLTFLIGFKKG